MCECAYRGYHRRRVKAVLCDGRSPGRARARDVQYTDALLGRWENPNWRNTGFRGWGSWALPDVPVPPPPSLPREAHPIYAPVHSCVLAPHESIYCIMYLCIWIVLYILLYMSKEHNIYTYYYTAYIPTRVMGAVGVCVCVCLCGA